MQKKKLFIFSLFLFCLTLWACKDKARNQPEMDKYIAGYTDGIIKSDAPIHVLTAIGQDQDFQAGTRLPEGLLVFTPQIKGDLYLKDAQTLEFIPEGRMINGKVYKATFHIDKWNSTVPKDYRQFEFEFKVIPLSVLFKEGSVEINEKSDSMYYRASLSVSDYMDPKSVEKKVTATIDGSGQPIQWEHNGNEHLFAIGSIPKLTMPQVLTISFDKEVEKGREFQVDLPGKNDFIVMDIAPDKDQANSLRITLSERVDPSQDLNGLITVKQIPELKFNITGNTINVYFDNNKEYDNIDIEVHPGIKSRTGNTLTIAFNKSISMPAANPMVRFIGKGTITPAESKVIVPFSAVGLKAVDVRIIKVFNQNMPFFLQDNSYDGANEIKRVARPVFDRRIDLQKSGNPIDLSRWNDFSIDLSELVKLEKGTIYRIEITFKRSYTTLDCAQQGDGDADETNWNSPGYYSMYKYPSGYEWGEVNNPCHISYYCGEHFIQKNIINTSLGIIAKKAVDDHYFISVNNLATAEPVANCNVILYDYQNQKIDSVTTDRNGFATVKPPYKAFMLVARKDGDKAFLKVNDAAALSLSNFDVSGLNVQSGVKGFIYGERGVWRPGDNIYLSFILEDKLKMLPEGHPVVAQLTDPKGNVVQTQKSSTNPANIYCFSLKTNEDAPTGYWNAVVKVGGLTFTKTLKVETIKANRLSINMIFPNDQVIGKGISTEPVNVKTMWLHGAKTPGRKAVTEVRLSNGRTVFNSYSNYIFDDRSKNFEPVTTTLFDGTTDAEGNFKFSTNELKTENAPGFLRAAFTTRVFENSGDFSISTYATEYSPYEQYVGIRLPDSEDNWYPNNQPVKLSGVVVDAKGAKVNRSSVEVSVYKLDWRWWWDSDADNFGSYISRSYNRPVFNQKIPVTNGTFTADLSINDWGRHYIIAKDDEGHMAGFTAYFGSWYDSDNNDMATMLTMSSDKKAYKVGEKVKVKIPSSEGGVAIVSLENGKTVKELFRVPASKGFTNIEFEATSEMCPNVYAHITLLQPHKGRDNDRPVRMYGILNINVEDKGLHLSPKVSVAEELRPAQDFSVTVSEKDGKAMNYTIAVVDEGLLSLTSFKTPDPFNTFYAREALGVKTWDFYDYVYGAYGARLEKAFAIGGDEALQAKQDEKTNRFKPVVLFEGPCALAKGSSRTHKFHMPEYIGKVRVMVIATDNGRYGSASAEAQVKKPLMVSVAMPRLFTPGDVITLPVTVFAMDKNIKEADVTISTDPKIKIVGSTSQTVKFKEQGEQIAYFQAVVNDVTGKSNIRFTAVSGSEKSVVSEEVDIRIPNPRITTVEERQLESQQSVALNCTIDGVEPRAMLEVTSIPPLNLEQRLAYLIAYPHGCAEQITSTVFPQLSLNTLIELDNKQKADIETNVKAVISRLNSYQTAEGGFSYWPGSNYVSEWVNAYVLHFLILAENSGYFVPKQMRQNCINYTQKRTNTWRNSEYSDPATAQIYRLYVLALAGSPDLAAMNRIKESRIDNHTDRWLLAGAYALCKQQEIAANIVRDISPEVKPYRQTGGCYGSDVRDNALILSCMLHMNMQQDAYRMLEKISVSFASSRWMSTQDAAFGLHAFAAYVDKYLGELDGINIEVTTPEGKKVIQSPRTIVQCPLTVKNGKTTVEIKNKNKGNLSVRQINSAAPIKPVTTAKMSGLDMNIRYISNTGTTVQLPDLQQGLDIAAEITVSNTGITGRYDELALTYMVPSGFEIINERLSGNTNAYPGAEYVDIRDDRFYLYFSLDQGQSKVFKFKFNTAYAGEYLVPAITCSAMYDNNIIAILPGSTAEIKK